MSNHYYSYQPQNGDSSASPERQDSPTVRIGRNASETLPVLSFPDSDEPNNEYAPPETAHTNQLQANPYANGNSRQYSSPSRDETLSYTPYQGYSGNLAPARSGYDQEYDPQRSFELQRMDAGPEEPWNASYQDDQTLLYNQQRRPSGAPSLGPTTLGPSSYSSQAFDNYNKEGHNLSVSSDGQQGLQRLNVFGLARQASMRNSEYADDNDFVSNIPIRGDGYALNTWYEDDDTEDGQSRGGRPRGLSEGNSSFEDDYDANGKSSKRVRLFKGNLVLDCPVSDKLLCQYPDHQKAREFTHMRYSAATCDPANFDSDEFTLRQMCYTQPRQTELCIAITIYNEDDILLARTLQGVFNNIRHLCSRSRSSVWGAEAWKRVVVCVIADGRSKLNPRAKALMAALGVYQEGFAKNMVNDRPVEGHIYEYTTMVRIASVDKNVKLTTENAVPVQMLFCLKEKNKKKINSHRWLFQAFCPLLQPKVVVLLDAGTRPGNHSIYHLWKSFHKNPQVAGACGEIAAGLGTGYNKLLNPLVAAQNFEYKMSNILDKPSESVFGFITVLPGAFSAYRYTALLNDHNNLGPLASYFAGERLEAEGGIFKSNMYLAEDRILCWELVAKRGCNYVLKYVKSAKAHTDVPEHLSELVLQRRRWLNGSFFASVYAQAHMFNIWRTSHSVVRKLWFHVEFLYQSFSLLFSWFSLANFFLVFNILSKSISDPSMGFAPGKVLSVVLTWIYCACLMTIFVLSLGNRPKGTHYFYDAIVGFFAVLMAYICFAAIYVAVKSVQYSICQNGGFEPKLMVTDKTFRDLIISLLATYALYFIASILSLEPWHMLTSFVQYILLSPAYINVFNVYAFCNTHDISWGTKGDDKIKTDLGVVKADDSGKVEVDLPTSSDLVDRYYLDEVTVLASPAVEEESKPSPQDQRTDYYAFFRSSVVLAWIFMNIALVAVVLNVGGVETLTTTTSTTATAAKRAVEHLAGRAACTAVVTSTTKTTEIYLAVVLWSVAGMSLYRFVCCLIFLTQWIFKR